MNPLHTTILLSASLILVQLSEVVSSAPHRNLRRDKVISLKRNLAVRGYNILDIGDDKDYDDEYDYEDDEDLNDELFYEDGPEGFGFEEDDYDDSYPYDDDDDR